MKYYDEFVQKLFDSQSNVLSKHRRLIWSKQISSKSRNQNISFSHCCLSFCLSSFSLSVLFSLRSSVFHLFSLSVSVSVSLSSYLFTSAHFLIHLFPYAFLLAYGLSCNYCCLSVGFRFTCGLNLLLQYFSNALEW